MKVKRTERGWGGHYILADKCLFRRNTLLEYKGVKLVVSNIGNMYLEGKPAQVGIGRCYETMVFYALNDKYNDANVQRQYYDFNSDWWLSEQDDIKANEMHENIVNEIIENLKGGKQ